VLTLVCFRRLAPAAALLLAGCSSDGAVAPSVVVPTGDYTIRADVQLRPDEGGETLTFLTPALSTFSMPASSVAGKPYYVALFTGGFDQGVDLDLHHEWGIVPDDLHIEYESPREFFNGPYDVSVIVYTETEITDAIRKDFYGVVPKSGELSAFTLSQERVRPGDPKFSNGVIRVNVEDADGECRLENRNDPADIGSSLTDTVLTVP
jgi:hypothetical protein